METIWFGVKLAFGLAIGFAVIFVAYREIRGLVFNLRFSKVGCTWQAGERPGTPSGWITRDARNDDWILWDVGRSATLRCGDDDPLGTPWRLSNETLPQFLTLAREYQDHWKHS